MKGDEVTGNYPFSTHTQREGCNISIGELYIVISTMNSWRAIVLMALFAVMIHGTKSEDDEAHVENDDEEDPILKPEVDPVPYVSPDIDPSVYFADHFDSDEAYEKRWIKSSAKKDGVEAAIDR